jgi:hypothetical protein
MYKFKWIDNILNDKITNINVNINTGSNNKNEWNNIISITKDNELIENTNSFLTDYTNWKNNHVNITIYEKNDDIFTGASYYNLNRLHLGYHYPKSYKTRIMCLKGYEKFIKLFSNIIEECPKNLYVISKESIIDYNTFLQIYNTKNYNHTTNENTFLTNIEGDLINTKEKIINSEKAKLFFKENLKNVKIIYNTNIYSIEQNDKVILNNTFEYDFCFNCSYNQLNLNNENCEYEKTISLIYKRIKNINDYNAITIMDGGFSSIFPRDLKNNTYTLTNVIYTPFYKNKNFKDVEEKKLTIEELENIKINMVKDITKYLITFEKEFEYDGYFESYKCKTIMTGENVLSLKIKMLLMFIVVKL